MALKRVLRHQPAAPPVLAADLREELERLLPVRAAQQRQHRQRRLRLIERQVARGKDETGMPARRSAAEAFRVMCRKEKQERERVGQADFANLVGELPRDRDRLEHVAALDGALELSVQRPL
jgi:hypothetical protein